jgi:putative exporter of polyketide antibiotics
VAWNWLIILHFIFAGMSLYIFLRYIKASRLAAFFGGAVLILSGYLVSVHNLLPHLFAVAWFTIIVVFFLKYIEHRN